MVVVPEAIAEAMRIRGHLRLGRLRDPIFGKLVSANTIVAHRRQK